MGNKVLNNITIALKLMKYGPQKRQLLVMTMVFTIGGILYMFIDSMFWIGILWLTVMTTFVERNGSMVLYADYGLTSKHQRALKTYAPAIITAASEFLLTTILFIVITTFKSPDKTAQLVYVLLAVVALELISPIMERSNIASILLIIVGSTMGAVLGVNLKLNPHLFLGGVFSRMPAVYSFAMICGLILSKTVIRILLSDVLYKIPVKDAYIKKVFSQNK